MLTRISILLYIAWHISSHIAVSLISRVYGEAIPVKELAERVASYVHLCTLYWWLRLILHLFYFNFIFLARFSILNLTLNFAGLLVVEWLWEVMIGMDHSCTWSNLLAYPTCVLFPRYLQMMFITSNFFLVCILDYMLCSGTWYTCT